MASEPPKAILFDIGGVCVRSPMQAIHDYEVAHSIPKNWVNFAIARSSKRPDGAWAQLERGEVELDAAFFRAFSTDLHDPSAWQAFCAQQGSTAAPVKKKRSYHDLALSESAPASSSPPPVPQVDATTLFWAMMIVSRAPEPAMARALTALRASDRFVLGALSNTVKFPAWHPLNDAVGDDIRARFDVFVSSAHAGLRKPHPEAYELAVRELDAWSRAHGKGEIRAEDVLFLDDIGQNLRTAREMGMRTIKVLLGKVEDAVKEMEAVAGMDLGSGGRARL